MADDLAALIESSLRFEWYGGAATPVESHRTGWMTGAGFGVIQCVAMRTLMDLGERGRYVIEPGSALVVDANVRCSLDSTAVGRAVARWCSGNFFVLGGISVFSLFDLPPVVAPPRADALGDLCAELGELHVGRPALDPLRFAARKLGLGLRLLEAAIGPATPNAHAAVLLANAQRLAPVLTHIDERLGRPTSRAALAKLAGLSPSRFHELFLAVLRRSPMAYVVERRMQRARQLLVTTARPVREIAAIVGYDDPYHFSRAFKRSSGESPLGYRAADRGFRAR